MLLKSEIVLIEGFADLIPHGLSDEGFQILSIRSKSSSTSLHIEVLEIALELLHLLQMLVRAHLVVILALLDGENDQMDRMENHIDLILLLREGKQGPWHVSPI